MPAFQIERIHHQTETELSIFRNQLNKLEVPNYPTKSCEEVIDHLHKKLQGYQQQTITLYAISVILSKAEGPRYRNKFRNLYLPFRSFWYIIV